MGVPAAGPLLLVHILVAPQRLRLEELLVAEEAREQPPRSRFAVMAAMAAVGAHLNLRQPSPPSPLGRHQSLPHHSRSTRASTPLCRDPSTEAIFTIAAVSCGQCLAQPQAPRRPCHAWMDPPRRADHSRRSHAARGGQSRRESASGRRSRLCISGEREEEEGARPGGPHLHSAPPVGG